MNVVNDHISPNVWTQNSWNQAARQARMLLPPTDHTTTNSNQSKPRIQSNDRIKRFLVSCGPFQSTNQIKHKHNG